MLSVGTFEPRKNQARLVRAYRKAVQSADLPHALVLAGHSGWRTDDLDREIADDGPGRVIRIESAGDQELDALYRAAALTAYVSLGEGFGMPVLGGDGPPIPGRGVVDHVDPRGRGRRRRVGRPDGRGRDRRSARAGPDRRRARRRSATSRPRTGGDVHLGEDGGRHPPVYSKAPV